MEGSDLTPNNGQRFNPFDAEFQADLRDIAEAAEAVNNPQMGGDGGMDLIPGAGLNTQITPADAADGTGDLYQGPRLMAKITGENTAQPGRYLAAQVNRTSGGSYSTTTNGYTWNDAGSDQPDLYCRQGIAGIPTDTVYEVWIELADDGTLRWVFDAIGWTVPVDLATDGGSNGTFETESSAGSAPTWTYTLTDKHGAILATGQSPGNGRTIGEYDSGDEGLAYLNNLGAWVLLWANEEKRLPPSSGDNWGYHTISAATLGAGAGTIGGQASESGPGGIDGEIRFAKPDPQTCADNFIGVHTEIVDSAGVDDVRQWIDFSEYKAQCSPDDLDVLAWDTTDLTWVPTAPPSVTDGVTSAPLPPTSDLTFSTATPGTDERAVVFDVTDNAPGATVTGVVDVSGLGGGSGNANVLDIEVEVAATSAGTVTLDTDNYSGRMLQFSWSVQLGVTDATWADYTDYPADLTAVYIGSSESADVLLVSATDIFVYVDASDGYKLKMDHSNPGATFKDHLRLLILKGDRKTTPDVSVT